MPAIEIEHGVVRETRGGRTRTRTRTMMRMRRTRKKAKRTKEVSSRGGAQGSQWMLKKCQCWRLCVCCVVCTMSCKKNN